MMSGQQILGAACLVAATSSVTCADRAADSASSKSRVAEVVADATSSGFAGCVLVREGEGIVFEQAIGPADREGRVSATIDTMYGVASMSKQFTAVAVLQLAEAGKLSLTDPITRYVHEVPEDKQAITVHQLLTHTSGLGQNYAADGIRDRDQAVRAVLSTALEKPTGEGFSYSNDGYALLAAIVETASGEEFDRYMQTHVFSAAGMSRTACWPDAATRPAPEAAELLRELPPANMAANWGFRGSSGVYTTVHDLDRYWTAVSSHKLISAVSYDRMFSPYATTRIGPYGYGWFVSARGSSERSWMTRGNEDFGPNGIIIVYPDRPLLIIVLSHRFQSDRTQARVDDIPMSRWLGERIEAALVP